MKQVTIDKASNGYIVTIGHGYKTLVYNDTLSLVQGISEYLQKAENEDEPLTLGNPGSPTITQGTAVGYHETLAPTPQQPSGKPKKYGSVYLGKGTYAAGVNG